MLSLKYNIKGGKMKKIYLSKILKELEFNYVRSSGPGGQNVNKRATKVQLRWNPDKSQLLTKTQKKRIKKRLSLTKKGVLILKCDQTSNQQRNEKIVIQRFKEMIKKALRKKKVRKKTKPSKVNKEKRLKRKKKRAEKKKMREKIDPRNY